MNDPPLYVCGIDEFMVSSSSLSLFQNTLRNVSRFFILYSVGKIHSHIQKQYYSLINYKNKQTNKQSPNSLGYSFVTVGCTHSIL